MGNNLKSLRIANHLTHESAAVAMGISRGQFIKLERGERQLNAGYIERASRAFGVPEADIFSSSPTVPLIGRVGAGAQMNILSDAHGDYERVNAPSSGATPHTVAVEIVGESLGELFDRWIIYYDRRSDPPTKDMLNRLCVLGLDDGRVLVKKLTEGGIKGRYTLKSNTEPPIYDAAVEWAAPVKQMSPR